MPVRLPLPLTRGLILKMSVFFAGKALQQQHCRPLQSLVALHQAVKAEAGGTAGARHNFTLGEALVSLGYLAEGCYFLRVCFLVQYLLLDHL